MKKIITHLLLTFITCFMNAQTPANDSHWQLVWEDDFNFLDLNKWTVVDWAHGNDKTLYLDDNVTVSGGELIIKAKNNPLDCEPNHPPTIWGAREPCIVNKEYLYNSGWIESNQLFNIQYGYIEASIRLPYDFGYHTAFWTFVGAGVVNPSNFAEIDIFEMLGQLPSNVVTTNIHKEYCPPNQICPWLPDYYQEHPIGNFNYTGWHTYAVEWSPSKIIWYVDGRVIRNNLNPNLIDPVRVLFNFALSNDHPPITTTLFPANMYVDYIKVYQKQKDCNNLINACNYNFATYDDMVKNSITIGNGGCTNIVDVGGDVTIRASEFVQIMGDFTVPLGSSFYVDANKNCGNTLDLKCTHLFNTCNYNFIGYDNSIKKEIDLGGSGCIVPIIPVNNNTLLRATDKVILKNGVTITPQNGNLVELSIVTCP